MDASPPRRHLHLVPAPYVRDPVDGPDPVPVARGPIVLSIDCDECAEQGTHTCDDCVVSHLLGHGPGRRVELDGEEYRQVELLAAAGLVPGSRFSSRDHT